MNVQFREDWPSSVVFNRVRKTWDIDGKKFPILREAPDEGRWVYRRFNFYRDVDRPTNASYRCEVEIQSEDSFCVLRFIVPIPKEMYDASGGQIFPGEAASGDNSLERSADSPSGAASVTTRNQQRDVGVRDKRKAEPPRVAKPNGNG